MLEATNDAQKIGQALNWIVSLLNHHNIPHQIVGGLAAKAYGAQRPLVDIDLYAPLDKAQAALEEMKPYIVRELLPHLSASWDLRLGELRADPHRDVERLGRNDYRHETAQMTALHHRDVLVVEPFAVDVRRYRSTAPESKCSAGNGTPRTPPGSWRAAAGPEVAVGQRRAVTTSSPDRQAVGERSNNS